MNINVLKVQILMGKRGITINQLAEKCQVSRQTISNITAKRSCNPITAYKIAVALVWMWKILYQSKIREERMGEAKYYVDLPEFTGRNVPISEIAKAIGKDAQYVRVGLQQGILKFGYAMKLENSSEFNYYCPDRKVWEETGYFRKEKCPV